MEAWEALERWARTSAKALSTGQIDQLRAYVDLLQFWTRRIQLVSRSQSDLASLLSKHVADSLFAAAQCRGAARIADLGSGGGFPGVPIAIVWPGVSVSLIESTGKKASFLEEVRRATGCGNLAVLNRRIEDVGRDPAHARTYDLATARALADLDSLRALAAGLLTPNGRLLAMRAGGEAETSAAAALDYTLPDGTPRRLLICPSPQEG